MGAPNHDHTKKLLTEIIEGWRNDDFELNDWEENFVISTENQQTFSQKQESCIIAMHEKYL